MQYLCHSDTGNMNKKHVAKIWLCIIIYCKCKSTFLYLFLNVLEKLPWMFSHFSMHNDACKKLKSSTISYCYFSRVLRYEHYINLYYLNVNRLIFANIKYCLTLHI